MMCDHVFLASQEQRDVGGELNDILVFDGEGRFLTRSTSDIPTLKKKNFFELLSDEEQDFFRTWSRAFSTGRLLLETSRGIALIFCRLYPETGVFVAVMFHTSREAMRRFWKNGFLENTRVSPRLVEKTLPRKEGTREEIDVIEKRLGLCAGLFDLVPDPVLGSRSGKLISVVARNARAVARVFGCGFICREETAALPAEGYLFSTSAFLAILSCLLSCVRLNGTGEEEPRISLFEEDGRVFFLLKAQIAGYKYRPSYTLRFDYPEFDACHEIAARRDLILDIVLEPHGENAVLSVRFSPECHDPAVLGLKNNFRFE